jgi:hypothetical protein
MHATRKRLYDTTMAAIMRKFTRKSPMETPGHDPTIEQQLIDEDKAFRVNLWLLLGTL